MPHVVIDGVVYAPVADLKDPSDTQVHDALRQLVAIQYFKESHKAIRQAWDVLNALAPELAHLAAKDPHAAYQRMNPESDD